jgi:hypothetical protein
VEEAVAEAEVEEVAVAEAVEAEAACEGCT